MTIGCREMNKNPLSLKELNIIKIQLLEADRVIVTYSDTAKIKRFIAILSNAALDTSKADFKSYKFVKFIDQSSNTYRIELFGNRFRFKGIKYLYNGNLLEEFKRIF